MIAPNVRPDTDNDIYGYDYEGGGFDVEVG